MALTPTSVLDASALLALVKNEPGAQVVSGAVALGAAINVVNWSEVLTWVVRRGGRSGEFQERLVSDGILGPEALLTIAGVSPEDARMAADLYPQTSAAGLSLADRLCFASGIRLGLPILTSDRNWTLFSVPGADVRLIR